MLLCIYMHRESASDSEVDPIVKLIWSKVCITNASPTSITNFYHKYYHKHDAKVDLGL